MSSDYRQACAQKVAKYDKIGIDLLLPEESILSKSYDQQQPKRTSSNQNFPSSFHAKHSIRSDEDQYQRQAGHTHRFGSEVCQWNRSIANQCRQPKEDEAN